MQIALLDGHQVRRRHVWLSDEDAPVWMRSAHPHQQLDHLAQRLSLAKHHRCHAVYAGARSRSGGGIGVHVHACGADQHVREADVHVGWVA